ncbi:MAG: 4Fe-4S dicluster domain-containing protein, partial [Candidatus Hermodarchaeota archaeon]
ISSNIFEVVLFPFNFINDAAETELLKLAEKFDVGFIAMKPFAGGRITNTSLALKYLLQFENVIPIPGIQNINEIDKNLSVLNDNSKLNRKDLKEIHRIRKELGYKFCQWCGYCITVCPQEIPIPRVINIKVSWNLWPTDTFIEDRRDHIQLARECIECGACEEICPYEIPIRSMIKEAISFYNSISI